MFREAFQFNEAASRLGAPKQRPARVHLGDDMGPQSTAGVAVLAPPAVIRWVAHWKAVVHPAQDVKFGVAYQDGLGRQAGRVDGIS